MFAKSLLFSSLLVCSFSIFVNVKASNTPDSDDKFLTLPINFERYNIIQATLDELGASATEPLMKNMMELTLGYEETTIKNLVIDIVKESKTNPIDREICLKNLAKAIHKYDKKHIADSKINQLAVIILENFPSAQDGDKPQTINLQKTITSKNQPSSYPLLDLTRHKMNATENNPKNSPNKKIELLKDEMLKGAAYGAGGALGAGTIIVVGLGIKKILSSSEE